MLCLELLLGLTSAQLEAATAGGGQPLYARLPASCPAGVQAMVRACFSVDPSGRPSFHDVMLALSGRGDVSAAVSGGDGAC